MGVGTNDAGYPVYICERVNGRQRNIWHCPLYRVWVDMLARCYSRREHARRPNYVGCSVAPEWLSFSAFREWMVTQDHEGKHLDKDLLVPGNKMYSPETCVFVSRELNSFMTDHASARGDWPIGVYWYKASGVFRASCCSPSTRKQEHLGQFADPDAAHEAWRARKHQHACAYADQQTDPRIAEALRSRYARRPAGKIAA